MSDVRFWVNRYIAEGWSPIPIPKGEKGPRSTGWEQSNFGVQDFEDDNNVGVHLGGKKGSVKLYDVDIDAKDALVAAEILLPPTNRISGRPGKPRSHWFYTCSEDILTVQYHGLGGSNDSIVELRGLSKTGSPVQTVVPPSVHPSGELITWSQDGRPLHFEQTEFLFLPVRNLAAATLIARGFPGSGHRHNPRMALAGYLGRCGLPDVVVMMIGKAAMAIIGGDVGDWETCCRTTLGKLKNDEKVMGGPSLKEMLNDGDQIVRLLNVWFGRAEAAALEEVIDTYNKKYFLVTVGSTPVVADETTNPMKFYTHENFRKMTIKDRLPDWTNSKGKTVKGETCADVWLKHPEGRLFGHFDYAPPPLTVAPGDYNGWRGFQVAPELGETPLIDYHLKEVICAGNDSLYQWLQHWCADLLQNPGEHGVSAILLMGGQGVGKGFFAHDLLGKLFDRRHYSMLDNSEHFYGRFAGEHLSGKCLVFLDEAVWGGDKRDAGQLKSRITGDTIFVDRKGISAQQERSMLHIILASNEEWPVGIDRDDRRFVALQVRGDIANDASYFEPLYSELNSGGREAFLAKMLAFTVDRALLRQPPNTAAKTVLKLRSEAPEVSWWQEKLDNGRLLNTDKTWATHVVRAALHADYIEYCQRLSISRRLYPNWFSNRLRKMCPSIQKAARRMGQPREWALPVLSVARNDFEKFLKSKVSWDDAEVLDDQTDL